MLLQNTLLGSCGLPLMLIAGGTGGGKTYFIPALIRALLELMRFCTFLTRKRRLASFVCRPAERIQPQRGGRDGVSPISAAMHNPVQI